MATGETEAGVDVLSTHPSKQTELRYRINVDESGTKATLASILAKRAGEATDGASLTIAIDAVGGELARRLVIDEQGNVGIGSELPQARLHVGGNGRFSGPLSVEDALTASRLEVSGIAKIEGDLNVTGSLIVATANLGMTRADDRSAVKISGDGTMRSPMWTVTQVYLNEPATPTPFFTPSQPICPAKPFTTNGGTLLILASGSGAALSGVPGPIIIGMDLFLNDSRVGSVLSRVNNMTEAKPFVTSGLVVRGIARGSYTFTLKTAPSTVVGPNDFFNVTILELPFQ